jgi:hypothetical protein
LTGLLNAKIGFLFLPEFEDKNAFLQKKSTRMVQKKIPQELTSNSKVSQR